MEAAMMAAACSRRSVFRWREAYEADGIAGLIPRPRSRLTPQFLVPEWVDRVIITVRLLTYWNSKRIAAELERRYIYKVGHTHIDQLLHDRGCSRGSISPVPGERYERTHPNELWHVDIKGPFFIQLASRSYLKTWCSVWSTTTRAF